MDENPFQPNLYTSHKRNGIAGLGAALLFVLFFVITVPLWLWRRNRVGRILAISWLVGAGYLGYGIHVYAQSGQIAYLPLRVFSPRTADAAVTGTEYAVVSPDAVSPTVTPPAPIPLPTLTPSPVPPAQVPVPTVTPWTDNPHWAVVTRGRLNVRAAPAADADIIGKLAVDACVEIVTLEADWLEVRLVTGEQGWSAREFLALAPSCPPVSGR